MARQKSKTGLWKGFTTPIWRDKAAWIALAVSAAIVLVQTPMWDLTDMSRWEWVGFALTVALSMVIGYSLVGTVVGFFRGFARGVAEGMEERPKDLEHKARSVGRIVSRVVPKQKG